MAGHQGYRAGRPTSRASAVAASPHAACTEAARRTGAHACCACAPCAPRKAEDRTDAARSGPPRRGHVLGPAEKPVHDLGEFEMWNLANWGKVLISIIVTVGFM